MQNASEALEPRSRLVRLRILLVVLLAFLFGTASFLRVFHSRGEPREAIVVQDMLRDGKYILADGYSNFVPSKPPLFHWISAVFSLIEGQVSEVTARMPSFLAAILAGLLVFNFFAKYSNRLLAFNSVLLLSTSFEWLRSGSAARVDMVLSCALVAAFIAIYNWDHNKYKGFPWILFVALTAAVLTKGPVGAVLPGFIFTVFALANREKFSDIILRGIKVFIPAMLIAGLWYLAAYLQRPEAFLNKIYFENVERFISTDKNEPHQATALTLYMTVIAGFMPWSLAVLALAFDKRVVIWNFLKSIKIQFQSWDKLTLFCATVIFCTLFFYSIPSSKRGVYVLPLYPFLSYLLTRLLMQDSVWLPRLKIVLKYGLAAVFLLPLLGILLSGLRISPVTNEILDSLSEYYYQHYSLFIFLAVILLFAFFWKARLAEKFNLSTFQNTFALLFCINVFVQVMIVPAVMNPISGARFAAQAKDLILGSKRVLSFGEEFYAISFYSNRTFFRAEDLEPQAGDLVIVDMDGMEDFKKLGKNYQELMRSSGSVISYGNKLMILRII